jgi:hypothetical protein
MENIPEAGLTQILVGDLMRALFESIFDGSDDGSAV